jgi:flagella basal body P-ring formation protein FlgA
VAENDRMRVTMTGKAKSSGGEGDIINVQNLNSLKEFPARIVDANTVVVAF